MMNEFMSMEMLATFAGLTMAVSIIVQFTKPLFKNKFGDGAVRIYSFAIALLLTFTFTPIGAGLSGIVLGVINSVLVSIASNGAYEIIKDPKATKK